MVVKDTAGRSQQLPAAEDPEDAQYYGTVVADVADSADARMAANSSSIPVLRW